MLGYWRQKPPTKSGTYWTATRDGVVDRLREIVRGKTEKEVINASGWEGFWWSEPVETPCAPPEWRDGK